MHGLCMAGVPCAWDNLPYHYHCCLYRLPGNTPKNRYKDVICYDETRVQLKSQEASDYIHANYVDSFKKPKAFILTQGKAIDV